MTPAVISNRTLADLFRLARAAHLRGDRWRDFWPTVAADVAHMADGDPVKRRRLVDRLLCLLVSGEDSGLEPPDCDLWGEPCGIQSGHIGAAR